MLIDKNPQVVYIHFVQISIPMPDPLWIVGLTIRIKFLDENIDRQFFFSSIVVSWFVALQDIVFHTMILSINCIGQEWEHQGNNNDFNFLLGLVKMQVSQSRS